jgi:hypothetical protein
MHYRDGWYIAGVETGHRSHPAVSSTMLVAKRAGFVDQMSSPSCRP